MNEFKEIPIRKVKSLENIRTRISASDVSELMQNIKQHGLLQPIGAWQTESGEFVVAYGHRRLAACDKLGWRTITAKLLGRLSFEELLVINTSENIHRKDITLAEIGRICSLLKDKGLSTSEVAVRLSFPISRVREALSNFKKIPEKYRKSIVYMRPGERNKAGKIPASAFNTIISAKRELGLNDIETSKLLEISKNEDLTVSQIRLFAALLNRGATISKAIKIIDKFNIRRINLPINKKVEDEMIKENNFSGAGRMSKLFTKILKGEIQGRKNLVF